MVCGLPNLIGLRYSLAYWEHLVYSFMGATRMVDLINTFSAQCCIPVGKSGHERVKSLDWKPENH